MDSINNERSYTEYIVTSSTTDFPVGFDDYSDSANQDNVLVTLDGVDVSTIGYTVQRKSDLVIKVTPAITTGTVRLQRETNIDLPFHQFTAGALFSAGTMDDNFAQIRHSQQEVRDGFLYVQGSALGAAGRAERAAVAANIAADDAITATSDAVAAAGAAITATNAADTAKTNADTATGKANTATSKANTAASNADAKASAAVAATIDTVAATDSANTATSEANAATSEANTATGLAIDATGAANAATSTLVPVRDAAVAATDSANLAASEANTATDDANSATTRANAATGKANTATSKANTATANANTAASGANTAKATTVVATDNANTAASAANAAADRVATVEAGKAAEITSVSASTVPPSTPASVVLGGTAQARTFAFKIPTGESGVNATITSATASTSAAGTSATVSLGGTPTERTFAFTIPKGDTGAIDLSNVQGTSTSTGISQKGFTDYVSLHANAASRKVGTAAGNVVERGVDGYPKDNNAIGVGQTWQDMKSDRVQGVTYTNSTGRPIVVSVTTKTIGGRTASLTLLGRVDNILISNSKIYSATYSYATTGVIIVPAGSTYSFEAMSNAGCAIALWSELR